MNELRSDLARQVLARAITLALDNPTYRECAAAPT